MTTCMSSANGLLPRVFGGDAADRGADSYQPRVRFTILTTDSITGTSISTPTTVASAAPEWKPNRLMAAATASSKKLLAPISAEGAGDAMGFAGHAIEQIGEPGVEIDLDQDRHGEQDDDQRLREDLLALEAEQQHQRRQQRHERKRLQGLQQVRQSGLAALGDQTSRERLAR